MAYLPMGPYLTDPSAADALWSAIHHLAREHRAAFLKWEPGIFIDEPAPDFTSLEFQSALQTIQPLRTVIIDISDDDEVILSHMNQGTRRKIRQSLKNDIRYYQAERVDLLKFNAIMQSTGERNEFGVHDPAYYQDAYELFAPDHAALFMAEHDDDVLAGIMVFTLNDSAWYLYGASSDTKRNLMASYGVQWQAIQWAKARGCRYYDMWGIPDEDPATLEAEFQHRSDGLWGVYGFKRGWGGEIVRSAGAWDYVYNPVIYNAYKLALKFI
jgi:lipid II:glycine glycyltransferase (peptidoglycan interpeptide bridge formation enzyme)